MSVPLLNVAMPCFMPNIHAHSERCGKSSGGSLCKYVSSVQCGKVQGLELMELGPGAVLRGKAGGTLEWPVNHMGVPLPPCGQTCLICR